LRSARLPDVKLPTDEWEKFVLDVAASKLDRNAPTRRLRKLCEVTPKTLTALISDL
jgi:hypothetical protein